jgi:hypothetical protein
MRYTYLALNHSDIPCSKEEILFRGRSKEFKQGEHPQRENDPLPLISKWGNSHIDVIEMPIYVKQCLVYMFPSMIGVDINVGIAINAKGGYCWITLSLMPKD